MALYLVIHEPIDPDAETALPPTRLRELAEQHGVDGATPRWLRTYSPDLHDERVFTMWDATNAAEVLKTIETFGFLNDMTATSIQVNEWGPEDVRNADPADD